jgi:hypothetical protein
MLTDYRHRRRGISSCCCAKEHHWLSALVNRRLLGCGMLRALASLERRALQRAIYAERNHATQINLSMPRSCRHPHQSEWGLCATGCRPGLSFHSCRSLHPAEPTECGLPRHAGALSEPAVGVGRRSRLTTRALVPRRLEPSRRCCGCQARSWFGLEASLRARCHRLVRLGCLTALIDPSRVVGARFRASSFGSSKSCASCRASRLLHEDRRSPNSFR